MTLAKSEFLNGYTRSSRQKSVFVSSRSFIGEFQNQKEPYCFNRMKVERNCVQFFIYSYEKSVNLNMLRTSSTVESL